MCKQQRATYAHAEYVHFFKHSSTYLSHDPLEAGLELLEAGALGLSHVPLEAGLELGLSHVPLKAGRELELLEAGLLGREYTFNVCTL